MSKVLIAEDNPVELSLYATAIQTEGHTAIRSSTCELAWEILCDNPDIELLITDMVMPEISGRDLIKRIRGDARFSSLPVIVVSGIVSVKAIRDLLALGEMRFLSKPVDIQELKKYVRALSARNTSFEWQKVLLPASNI